MAQPPAPTDRLPRTSPRRRRWPWVLLGSALSAPFVLGGLWILAVAIALQGPGPTSADRDRRDVLEAEAVLDVDPDGGQDRTELSTAGSCCGLWNSSHDTTASAHWELDREHHLDALRTYARAAVDDGWVIEVPSRISRRYAYACGRLGGRKDFGSWSAGLVVELRDAPRGDLHVTLSTRAVEAGGSTPDRVGPGRYVDEDSGATLDADVALARLCLDAPAIPPPSTTSPS